MKSLFTRILLALTASTVLALLSITLFSQWTLQRGFVQFLAQQEERQLQNLLPELARFYQLQGGWEKLAGDPRRWMRLLARARPEGVRPPDEAPAEFLHRPPGRPARLAEPDARHLWRRLFLLDQDGQWIAGAGPGDRAAARLAKVEVDGRTVGWVGFRPAAQVTAPEAHHFLEYQGRALLWSLLVALLLATALGYLLARSLSRPVVRLRNTVQELTRGQYAARVAVGSDDEIGQLARHVNRLAETLEKNETARRRWTADVAHELRTPLAVLQGEIDAVRDGVRPYSAAAMASLHEEVAHLVKLVDDLQTLALADAGALNMQMQGTDFAELVRQVLDSFVERLAAAGLNLESHLPQRLELLADAQRLRQLLHNLLENACRYTASPGTVRVTLGRQAGCAVLQVEDSAPGVEAVHLQRLFERFYRVESSRGRAQGGSGLGLAVCRNIVEAHGGEISAADSAMGGLLVMVKLPLEV
jgi:two-component system sensor histidine kinase BaeS